MGGTRRGERGEQPARRALIHAMAPIALTLAAILVVATLIDAFEVVLLPRPVRRRIRLNRYFFKFSWDVWARCAGWW